ncbi:carboxypeptidase-like protein [Gramella sp. Hel_I_59]|uniref:carboxypeptidase-like regulatory domain-containing protein n=1 Tax=Gramella sp. Hel_I_59 TaxID=1249978 RepID=UPI00114E24A4|nr:carboxypeptidase-like regulatory domain-containing protein [Gramella sp. Hel_I_59]TQI71144.1 carboxypeptidase-like protein [Gramella sp. Hel_I_59]
MKKNLLIKSVYYFVFLISYVTFSQERVIEGIVTNSKNENLDFVNIGIKNKNIGTITDEEGNFQLVINDKNKEDTLSFSYVGFGELNLRISDVINNDIKNFKLKEKSTELDEIVIHTKKKKEKELGTTSYVSMVAGYVRADNDKNKNIQEFAKELKIKKPSKILDLNINLFNVNVDTTSFRVNFYSIKDDLPFEKISSKNIIIEQNIENGWNSFDLEKFNLKFENPVFITLEYLPKTKDEEEPFRYSGQLLGKSITRSSSFGTWDIKKGISMSMYVTVEQ